MFARVCVGNVFMCFCDRTRAKRKKRKDNTNTHVRMHIYVDVHRHACCEHVCAHTSTQNTRGGKKKDKPEKFRAINPVLLL